MKMNYLSKEFINYSHELELTDEQNLFIKYALKGHNILVDACIGSGKTTAIQHLCNLLPSNKHILYLTYNRLLKIDAQEKIFNKNVHVQNYHGYAAEMLNNNGIRSVALDDLLTEFNRNQFSLPLIDVLIIDEYQDIDSQSADMIKYIKKSFPEIQIVMVGDMCQKIYDYTSLNIPKFVDSLLDDVVRLKFSKCFRLSKEWAHELGNVWGKNIQGVNDECEIIFMGFDEVTELLLNTKPEEILCLGSQQGANSYTAVLNKLEETKPDIFNKYTVYASIRDKDIKYASG